MKEVLIFILKLVTWENNGCVSNKITEIKRKRNLYTSSYNNCYFWSYNDMNYLAIENKWWFWMNLTHQPTPYENNALSVFYIKSKGYKHTFKSVNNYYMLEAEIYQLSWEITVKLI